MKLSQYFLPLIKENQSEATIISHNLMLKAGMIRQNASGIYSWLPLGLKVLQKIEYIIRKNLDNIGAQEMLMPCIQHSSIWKESGRYDDYGKEMLRIKDRHDQELLFGPTNEELLTDIFRKNVKSYKDLPKILYQIQWKFRDEIRPRFGVLRGREFLMKDAYSFDIDAENAKKSYFRIFSAYLNIFKNMGLKVIPVKADSGPIGGDLNHEFHIIAENGESNLYFDKAFLHWDGLDLDFLEDTYAVADEKHDNNNSQVKESDLIKSKGIEIGHIFYFGTKYSKPLNAVVQDQNGKEIVLEMGSYGIGVSRLVGAIIEANHDDKGIVWSKEISPFDLSIINLDINNEQLKNFADKLYRDLINKNINVLYDDTDNRVGVKFASNDLIGIPLQIIIGQKNMKNNFIEIKHRKTSISELIEVNKIEEFLQDYLND
jgi:prolyl-tRNA synthetase